MANRMTVNYEKKPCYDIVFTRDFSLLTDELSAFGADGRRVAVICDSNTERLFGGSEDASFGLLQKSDSACISRRGRAQDA